MRPPRLRTQVLDENTLTNFLNITLPKKNLCPCNDITQLRSGSDHESNTYERCMYKKNEPLDSSYIFSNEIFG